MLLARVRGLRWVRRLAVLVVALGVVLVGGTAAQVWQVGRQDARPVSDVIVVLGAAQFNGRPSATLKARLDHAAELYREGVAPRVVTVGGRQPGDRFTEARVGNTYLQSLGIPDQDILPVTEGDNTLHSLQAFQRVARERGWTSAVLVTDPWHSLRTRAMARDLGIRAQTSPTRTGPSTSSRRTEVRYIGRETLGYLYYRFLQSRGSS